MASFFGAIIIVALHGAAVEESSDFVVKRGE